MVFDDFLCISIFDSVFTSQLPEKIARVRYLVCILWIVKWYEIISMTLFWCFSLIHLYM